ncbi:MAG TPA: bifunctional 4-hydroxy-2-oxoglutarate aldolase/2-dehydro-3-deoxy-phosphogluconate aldolase [Patescibacteria group bacterium]|nr:bifunctional 4-hydroxy-2-oxoglutarate aldolase/2-dehydro-3-deoxy-phosphogluconate aldolase [Patescibacteria group bacterium]
MVEDFGQRLRDSAVIAIMRARSSDQLLDAAEALRAGGVTAIEVTLTTPGSLDVIRAAIQRFEGRVLFGAGTVLDPESARAAILAGAQFVVAPSLHVGTIEMCRRYSVPVMPGAFTPTEIVAAWQAGADYVKVFPASLGGPGLIKAIRGPLPQVRLVPVGGVDLTNTAEFVRAGADVVGVGGELVSQQLLDARDFATITEIAGRFRAEVEAGRAARG